MAKRWKTDNKERMVSFMNIFRVIRRIAESLAYITQELQILQQKLDLLLTANPQVSGEQLKKLKEDTAQLRTATSSLTKSIEEQQKKG